MVVLELVVTPSEDLDQGAVFEVFAFGFWVVEFDKWAGTGSLGRRHSKILERISSYGGERQIPEETARDYGKT